MGLPAGGGLSLFCPGGELGQPPPAHMGIPPPYQLDSKLGKLVFKLNPVMIHFPKIGLGKT